MPEWRSSTCFWLLVSLIGGSLACSVVAALGLLTPFSAAAAGALAVISLSLLARDRWSRNAIKPDQAACGDVDMTGVSYEVAVAISYAGRISRSKSIALLDRTAAFLACCGRLKGWIEKVETVWGDPGPDGGDGQTLPDKAGPAWVMGAGTGSIGSILQEVISNVREMAGVLRDVDHNAKELITSTEETAYSMTRLDSFLQDMANSGRDLEASTDTANRVALEGTKVVEEMGRENEAIITTVNEAASAVEDLGRWSQEVGKIVEVIRDIANETNLLALNASIIAAQSGEHGKAFGVVAEEIRGLAERTSSSTKEISDLVKSVQKNVANVVNSMKKSLQRVERGELLTRNAGSVLEKVFESFESSRNLAKQIASSTFEHKIDSSQVVRSLHKVTDIARRLQSHDFAGWTGSGETLGVARALSALYEGGDAVKNALVSSDLGGKRCSEGESGPPVGGAAGDVRGLLAECGREVGCCMESLNETKEMLDSWLEVLDRISRAVGSSLPGMAGVPGAQEVGACWEIAQCDSELRERCQAYKKDDRSLFFSPSAACLSPRDRAEAESPSGDAPSRPDPGHTSRVAHKVGS